jgi:hypothetical protein
MRIEWIQSEPFGFAKLAACPPVFFARGSDRACGGGKATPSLFAIQFDEFRIFVSDLANAGVSAANRPRCELFEATQRKPAGGNRVDQSRNSTKWEEFEMNASTIQTSMHRGIRNGIRRGIAAACLSACLITPALADFPGLNNNVLNPTNTNETAGRTVSTAELDQIFSSMGFTVRRPSPQVGFIGFERQGITFDVGYFFSEDGKVLWLMQNLITVPANQHISNEQYVSMLNVNYQFRPTAIRMDGKTRKLYITTPVANGKITRDLLNSVVNEIVTVTTNTRPVWESIAKGTTSPNPAPAAPVIPVNQPTNYNPFGPQNNPFGTTQTTTTSTTDRVAAQNLQNAIDRTATTTRNALNEFQKLMQAALQTGRPDMPALSVAYQHVLDAYSAAQTVIASTEIPASEDSASYIRVYRESVAADCRVLSAALREIGGIMQNLNNSPNDSAALARANTQVSAIIGRMQVEMSPYIERLIAAKKAFCQHYGLS